MSTSTTFCDNIAEFQNDLLKCNGVWARGDLELLKMPKISIVGSRKMSVYTKNLVSQLCAKLSKNGICVVSGGAIGVDISAAVAAGKNTIAVLPSGLNQCYPKSNEKILKQIQQNSLALSEYSHNHLPRKFDFLNRNRLVVALGSVLVIAQADAKSGSLNSSEWAKKLGKEIFVLPQRIGESDGTNALLAKGEAKIIHDLDAFLEYLKEHYFYSLECYETFCDELIEFVRYGANLDDVLARFGDLVYDYEIDGKIVIDGVLVRAAE